LNVQGVHALAVAALVLAGACGGGGGNPAGPSGNNGGGGGGGGAGPSGATVTVGTNGAVSPTQVTINVGQSVTFTNNSNRTRNVSSDPHPDHNECPSVNAVNALAPGQTKLTAAFTTARTCGFHDHDDPDNASLKGSIVIR
jgi:plastocyanin